MFMVPEKDLRNIRTGWAGTTSTPSPYLGSYLAGLTRPSPFPLRNAFTVTAAYMPRDATPSTTNELRRETQFPSTQDESIKKTYKLYLRSLPRLRRVTQFLLQRAKCTESRYSTAPEPRDNIF
ncbi:hypothetical protein Zmor_026064 [Zophobas morio]|uniref:Uncharacterized protein n=1 Tax=Zophobas morio TaxID=2755281 RepID=A0AA38HUP5_9CUCU|nr:hypothetical protein Zmor_026064 [Zophobas morio]